MYTGLQTVGHRLRLGCLARESRRSEPNQVRWVLEADILLQWLAQSRPARSTDGDSGTCRVPGSRAVSGYPVRRRDAHAVAQRRSIAAVPTESWAGKCADLGHCCGGCGYAHGCYQAYNDFPVAIKVLIRDRFGLFSCDSILQNNTRVVYRKKLQLVESAHYDISSALPDVERIVQ